MARCGQRATQEHEMWGELSEVVHSMRHYWGSEIIKSWRELSFVAADVLC